MVGAAVNFLFKWALDGIVTRAWALVTSSSRADAVDRAG